AWRTVARVNRARLAPGDVVLLRGGATFRHALMPPRSGRPNAPIVFGSYGRTRARLPRGVWFRGLHDLKLDRLALPGASLVGRGNHISLTRSAIGRGRMGVYAEGSDWWITSNKVHRTGDSGLILIGKRMTVAGNRIERTGRDRGIPWGKHGIYLRVAHAHVVANAIRHFADNGISVRYRNSVVEGNHIAGGPIGIAWFQNDRRAGTSSWIANEITGTTAAAIYVSPSDAAGATRESFVISGNRLRPRSGHHLDLQRTVGSYLVAGNERE
nr:right-handed parallel beta-helix repeat-containing protein [Actinomycetota bacterium]